MSYKSFYKELKNNGNNRKIEQPEELTIKQLSCINDLEMRRTRAFYLLRFRDFADKDSPLVRLTIEDYMAMCDSTKEGKWVSLLDTDSIDQGEINISWVECKKMHEVLVPMYYTFNE